MKGGPSGCIGGLMFWISVTLIWVCLVALVAIQPDEAITTEPDRPRGLW
jgi:hypothetical protein